MTDRTNRTSTQPDDPRLQAVLPAVYEPCFLAVTDSIQAEAQRQAEAGAEEGRLIWAAEQTDGHGQHGPWASPPGGLYCAVLLRPDFPVDQWPEIGLVALLALGTTVAELLPPLTGLDHRWPNDILVNGHKVGGIYLTRSGEALIIGAQLNIAPPIEGWEYASLVDDAAAVTTPGEALSGFARHLIDSLQRWNDQGLAAILQSLGARGLDGLDAAGGRTNEEGEPVALATFFQGLAP